MTFSYIDTVDNLVVKKVGLFAVSWSLYAIILVASS